MNNVAIECEHGYDQCPICDALGGMPEKTPEEIKDQADSVLDAIKLPNANGDIFTEDAMRSLLDPVGNNKLVEKKKQKEQENLDIAEQILKDIHIPESEDDQTDS